MLAHSAGQTAQELQRSVRDLEICICQERAQKWAKLWQLHLEGSAAGLIHPSFQAIDGCRTHLQDTHAFLHTATDFEIVGVVRECILAVEE